MSLQSISLSYTPQRPVLLKPLPFGVKASAAPATLKKTDATDPVLSIKKAIEQALEVLCEVIRQAKKAIINLISAQSKPSDLSIKKPSQIPVKNLKPEDVVITGPSATLFNPKETADVLKMLYEAEQRQATRRNRKENPCGRYVGNAIEISDGENTIMESGCNGQYDTDVGNCGERLTYNVAKAKYDKLFPNSTKSVFVTKLVITGPTNAYNGHAPCTVCLEFMSKEPAFRPSSQIIFLESPDQPNSKPLLRVYQMRDMILQASHPPSKITKEGFTIQKLSFSEPSPAGKQILQKLPETLFNETAQKRLLQAAKEKYDESLRYKDLVKYENKRMGFAALFEDNRIYSAYRWDYKGRYHESPEQQAFIKAFEDVPPTDDRPPRKLIAIAYYGNDPSSPSLQVLGLAAADRWGGHPDVLILRILDNQIKLEALPDYIGKFYNHNTHKETQSALPLKTMD